jgi:hypothetical protein
MARDRLTDRQVQEMRRAMRDAMAEIRGERDQTELERLRAEVRQLTARVAALEARRS